MSKSFNKTGLSVGDIVTTALNNTFTVLEVFENTFIVECNSEGIMFTFQKAIEEGWTILDNEPKWIEIDLRDQKKHTTSIQFNGQKFVPENNVNTAIIANNNELIEEMKKLFVPVNYGWASSLEAININDKINKSIKIIQSKNDLLSTE